MNENTLSEAKVSEWLNICSKNMCRLNVILPWSQCDPVNPGKHAHE